MTLSRTLQRVVLPLTADPDVLSLYVEFGEDVPAGTAAATGSTSSEQLLDNVLSRRSFLVPAGSRASFATYFNAFPASYWRRWTAVQDVELRLRVSGAATVVVYRSNAKGESERVAKHTTQAEEELSFLLPLRKRFGDGGWYWFDVVGRSSDVVVENAAWLEPDATDDLESVPTDGAAPNDSTGGITVAVTTFNRPSFVVELLEQLAISNDVLDALDEVLVVDQGTQKARAQEGFDEAREALGGRLRLIEQPNVGGSGGFARGMAETLATGRSRYVLLMDDDVRVEPESILRALAFADRCRRPTLVGGHMFNLTSPSRLQHFGEVVKPWRFHFRAADGVPPEHDFRVRGLRATPWMHRRVDVDYNAWWMCLVPVEVLKTAGLALPVFIKWDDAEYGLRAGRAGYPTVTLPGMAVWHMPFTDKDDNLDWQAYFHQRNRLVAALLHSPYPRGGRLVRDSLYQSVYHLMSMQYSVADLRKRAIEDVLTGPGNLHAELATKLPEIRALRASYADSTPAEGLEAFPEVARTPRLNKDRSPQPPRGRLSFVLTAATAALQQLRAVPTAAVERPQVAVPALDAHWWRLSHLDSALVSSSDGGSVAWYRRDRDLYRRLLRESIRAHERLLAEWPELSRRYREAAGELTSLQTWNRTFATLDRQKACAVDEGEHRPA